MDSLHETIKKDRQIWKFCFYGFFKNLRFFEPYLYIYFLHLGFSLFEIGLLFSIREITVYILEIPTGVFADNYGKKKSLLLCFSSYIVSFILFFFTRNFLVAAFGMIMYAFGEAFRSGTHKAMIYSYLERKGWFSEKAFVYGRTRSFSLLGSAVSAFLSIVFVLNIPAMKWIFIITIVPYILDFLLVLSYPDYLDEKIKSKFSFKEFIKSSYEKMLSIMKNTHLARVLVSSALYDGIFKSTKDYIQPVLKNIILASGIVVIAKLSPSQNVKVVLGIVYGIFYIFSSSASRNVYRVLKFIDSFSLMNLLFDLMGIIFIALYFVIGWEQMYLVIILYFILYLMKDARRPLVVDVLGDMMKKSERATVFSVDSELRALFMAIYAPLFGYISDKFSIQTAFLLSGIFILALNLWIKQGVKYRVKLAE